MLYNFLLVIYLLIVLPKTLYEYIFFKKKKRDLLKSLGLKSYKFENLNKKPVIWIHAVSLGETKASLPLIESLKNEYPNTYIIISNTTQTGHDEAKKSLFADDAVFFPFDFSFIIKRIFSQINLKIVIFIETDLWLNFIKEAKKKGSKVIVVSAKMSEKSHKRFSKIPKFSRKLFSQIDLILPQDEIHSKRFASFIYEEKLKICGNLKFVNNLKIYSQDFLLNWVDKLYLKNRNIITIASTHEPEEEFLIKELKDVPDIKILLAPRHPERFLNVYNQIRKITSCSLLSDLKDKNSKIILIDQMGILDILYQLSHLAIVGGSYTNRVGGHNILEPVFVKTPVFFGPFMQNQLKLREIVLNSNCGRQIELKDLKVSIQKYFENKTERQSLQKNCLQISKNSQNILQNTLDSIKKLI